MELLVVLDVYQGFPEEIWITDNEETAQRWEAELDARYSIQRDEDGEHFFCSRACRDRFLAERRTTTA